MNLARFESEFGTRAGNRLFDATAAATVRQIHSNRVIFAERPGVAGEGDALITQAAGLGLAIRTADCYPILLADPVARAAAAIHAGWRGTAGRIVAETIRHMRERFGTNPADLVAEIGPGIGECCYEVGPEVARHFGSEERMKVDLARANRDQLAEAGVTQIGIDGRCTFCEAELFYSFRREAENAGRMISFIRILPD